MTKTSLNIKLNSIFHVCDCALQQHCREGARLQTRVLVSFLIASSTLIGTIYHSPQPRGSLWKFSCLWVSEYLILLTTQHPLFKSTHFLTTHTHTHTWGSFLPTFDPAPFQKSKGVLKDREKGSLLRVSIFPSPEVDENLCYSHKHTATNLSHTAAYIPVKIQCFITDIKCVQEY